MIRPTKPAGMIWRTIALMLVIASCGRPLTDAERAFAAGLHGPELDASRVRLVEGSPAAAITFRRKPRPRVSCRERILPPPQGGTVTTKPAAVTLFNTVLFDKDWYTEDYLSGFPARLNLVAAMLFGHEMTHVWQWQNRERTGYSPLRAAAEHGATKDPYLFDLKGAPDFLDYGYEQQGAIVEEYICCRALAPQAARTKRLHTMLKGAFPVSDLPHSRESAVRLPWKGAKIEGICD